MKLYIITGEKSGDNHAANLVRELKDSDNNINIRAWGGDKLREEGVEIVRDIQETSFMGLWDVLLNIRKVKENLSFCKKDILEFNPEAIILVDYPGFNLRIAKYAKSLGIKIFYYIAPKVWAWNRRRVYKIRKYVDQLLVIFPFEVEFFRAYDIPTTYVGNPLIEPITSFKQSSVSNSYRKPLIALLPGSRKKEIDRILPSMLSVVDYYDNYQFVIAGTSNFSKEYYQSFIKDKRVDVIIEDTYSLLNSCDIALVASGTATLEVALFKVPQIVCYKTDWLTYFIAKLVIRIKYISLVNILLNKNLVRELIQGNLNRNNLISEIDYLLDNKDDIISNYNDLIEQLKEQGKGVSVSDLIIDSKK